MALAEYVIRHTAPDEALLNGVNAYAANLYNPDADYFGLASIILLRLPRTGDMGSLTTIRR